MVGHSQTEYTPISLLFINGPNPIEPDTTHQQHPTTSASWLEQLGSQNSRQIAHDPAVTSLNTVSPNHKSRRSDNNAGGLLDLPELPVASHRGNGRLRIPPTLSGLHQPPPNAGLLPSISTEQPQNVVVIPDSKSAPTTDLSNGLQEKRRGSSGQDAIQTGTQREKAVRNKWTEEETAELLKGVARFGVGQWTKILQKSDYNFSGRSALDLKDRFRVCCPDILKASRPRKRPAQVSTSSRVAGRPSTCEQISSTELQELGITEPFAPSKRRKRGTYSAEEDEAIVKGVEKHGNAWAVMRLDVEFSVLINRTATDLRDRYRARYPEKHKELCLKARSNTSCQAAKPQAVESPTTLQSNREEVGGVGLNNKTNPPKEQITPPRVEKAWIDTIVSPNNAEPPPIPASPHIDDVFWGLPFDELETDGDRVTLDRTILDWPFDGMGKTFEGNGDITSAAGFEIGPLFSSPLPGNGGWSQMPPAQSEGTMGVGSQVEPGATLPSLALVTAGMTGDDEIGDQLELPSLMSGLGGLEGDGRSGANLMSLYDILS